MTQKTVMVVAPYFPPHSGGLERYAKEISHILATDHGWRVVVVTTGEGTETKESVDGMIIYRLPYQFKISNTPFSFGWFSAIRRIVREEKPDIMNVHTPVPGIGDIAALATRVPLVVTYHAGSMRKGRIIPDIVIALYERFLLPLMLRKASQIVCSSDSVRFGFLKKYTNKSSTISPAVDSALFSPGERDIPARAIFVAADLSKACEYKGLGILLIALAKLRAKNIDLHLDVVGDGDMRAEYERRAVALGISDIVRFHGRLQGEQLAAVYRKASIFALPTSNDSYPVSILEAMSSGLPVVSTTVGDIPHMIEEGKTGFCIETKNERQLIEKLIILNDAKLRTQMGEAARAKILQEFNWKERAARTNAVFEKILAKKPVIVHVAAYYPPHVGGMEQRVRDLSRKLVQRDYETRVLTSNIDACEAKQEGNGVEVSFMPAFEFANTPITPALMWQLARLPRNSVIHLHVAHAFFPEMTALIAKARGIPYVAHVRAIAIPSGRFGALLPIYHRLVTRPVLRGAHSVIVLTDDYRGIVASQFDIARDRIHVIPNATTFRIVEKSHTLQDKRLNLLAVGRISVQKNYSLMLDAMALLAKSGSVFRLTIVGGGDTIDDLKSQASRLGIADRVVFAGELFGDQLEAVYEAADIFIHTSLFETFGTVFIEAMAKGLPIVASNVPGTRNVVKEGRNGLLTPFSAAEIASAIVRLSSDASLYASMSQNNLRDVQTYDWDSITERTITLYEAAYAQTI